MRARKALLVLAVLAGLVVVVVAWLSADRCGAWTMKGPALTQVSQSQGPVRVGAASVPVQLEFPMVVGGYGPPRATVERALTPVAARAVVLDVGGQTLNLVTLEVLLIPPQLRDEIAAGQRGATWVIATHTHSGPSGFDPRAASELAALGNFSAEAQQRLVNAARTALTEASSKLQDAKVEIGESNSNALAVARSGKEVDRRVTRVRFDGNAGPIAQLLIIAGHPTLVERRPEGLHADWPGLLASAFEREGGPVTLVVQGAGGNASIDRQQAASAEAAAAQLEAIARAVPTAEVAAPVPAAWDEVRVSLPRPEASRVAPMALLVPMVENALCDDAEDVVLLHALRLGDERFLFVPLEPSLAAALVLEEQSGADRLVSLADGYAGYVETVEVARAGEGESKRQYFPAELLTSLADGARLAGESLAPVGR